MRSPTMHHLPLVRVLQGAILTMRPIVLNKHGGFCLYGSICGLKGAVETSINGASVHSLLWDAGSSPVPFCFARKMKI